MTMEEQKGFPIIGAVPSADRPNDGMLRSQKKEIDAPRISEERLKKDLERLSSVVASEELFNEKPGGVKLEEITLRVEVSASGELGFVVASGSVNAGASIELKFKRSQ
ncbi:MAG: hypothetical protein HWE39_14165 [Oceanospirillaceae bacterium]|uniref:Pepco domain-containing protein n=1 Tax=Salipiger sp. HF18 TaxID=2721557 RepID=UPI00142E23FD|nr:hypothetical protein [Salipiger sp. HF18]NIY95770.1 hypothetical protein [Salipiger sp. HF18]NVK42382.1 hypothetical protein [Oceanospirillaceae bacterium]